MDWSNANFGYDSTGAFNSTADNLIKNPLKGGGKGMAFPWMAAAAFGSSALEGIMGGRQAAEDRRVAAEMGTRAAEEARLGAFRNNQTNLWNTIVAPRHQYELQKEARNYANLFFEPQEQSIESENRRRQMRDIYSPEGRLTSALSRSNDIARNSAERRAVTDAMFGAPVFASSRFTNPAWMQTA